MPLKTLEALCASPDPDPWPVDAAAAVMRDAGQSADALGVFKHAIVSESCNPQVATAAIRLLLAQRSTIMATWFFLRLKPGELQRRAAAPLMHGLAENKSEILIRWLLWRRREVLFKDDAAWGQVGFALSKFNLMKQVARWLSDWRQRPDVQPWMLFNYCLALRHQGRYAEVTEVARYVIQTWGHREGSADMRLFLAVEDALAGAIPSAQQHLQQLVIREDVAHDQELLALAKALVEFQQMPAAERSRQFESLRRQLGERFAAWRLLRVMKDVRRTFRRAGKVFIREGGGWRARLWFGWKLNWQWSLVLAAPVLLAIAVQPAILPGLFLGLLIWRFTRSRQS